MDEAALAPIAGPAGAEEAEGEAMDLSAWGRLTPQTLHALRRRAFDEVVEPYVSTLIDENVALARA